MPRFTLEALTRCYEKMIRMAGSDVCKNHYEQALHNLDSAAILANTINWRYKDDRAEQLTAQMAAQLLPRKIENYEPFPERYVFYDQIGNGTVLGLQYLRALMSWGAEILYIMEPGRHTRREEVLSEIRSYNKAQVIVLDDNPGLRLAGIRELYNRIVDYRAGKAFLHAPAEGAFGVTLWQALGQIERFRIVPGDHHFYLGTSVTDYALEFRSYGVSVAQEKRGFVPEQILVHPYYPIVRTESFAGFPEEAVRNRVVIVSGGAFYKTYGRNDTFFRLIRELVDRNPQIVVLFAGGGETEHFRYCIARFGLEKHLIPLGYRKDIDQVVRHGDIYLGTYPFCGGLMSQYAAANAKPILQYTTPDLPNNFIEDLIGRNPEGRQVTFTDSEQFLKYADRLIRDESFRRSEGEILSKMVITPESFSRDLRKNITNKHPYNGLVRTIDYDAMTDFYMIVANFYSDIVERIVLGRYKVMAFLHFPGIAFRSLHGSVLCAAWKQLCGKK